MSEVVGLEEAPRERGLFFARWRTVLTVLFALLLCLVPFLPGLEGPFQLDDTINLEPIHVGDASVAAIYQATFNNNSGLLGRPLSNLSFIANQLIGGYDPAGYKLVNLVIHFLCGVLVFLLASRLLPLLLGETPRKRHQWIALGAAILWAIHPLQVSTVLYVVQRMTQLSALFMLLAIYIALGPLPRKGGLPRHRDGVRHAVVIGVVALVAVACKENGALVPFLLLSIGLSLPAVSRAITHDTDGKKTFWTTAVGVPIALSIAVLVLSWSWISNAYAGRDFTLTERLLTQPVIIGGYLKSFFIPDLRDMGLFLDGTPVIGPNDALAWIGVAVVGLVALVAWLVRRRAPVFAFAVFWFGAAHLLESTVLPLELAFEHRNYLALFGLCLLVAVAVARLQVLTRSRVSVVVMAAVIATLGFMTFLRASTWSEQRSFINTEVRHHPESIRAQTEAAILESMSGDNVSAIRRIHGVQRAHPNLFYPLAMDMDLGCAVPEYPVQWGAIRDLVERNPFDVNITSFHKTIALKILRDQCKGDIAEAFETHLDRLLRIFRDKGMRDHVQFFLMIKADLQDSPAATRQLLLDAIDAAPANDAALYRLAYFDLNAGNLEGAGDAIAKLGARTPSWSPDRHRVEELERFLLEARQDAGTGFDG